MKTFLYDNCSIYPDFTSIIPVYDYDKPYTSHRAENFKTGVKNIVKPITTPNKTKVQKLQESYELSKGERKRLRYACGMLKLLSKPKKATNYKVNKKFEYNLAFITLTLPSAQNDISDKQIKNVYLKRFLARLRDKYGLRHYVWKSEAQLNGNLHIHLTANVYIHYALLRREWIDSIRDSGLIDLFYEKFGHVNPPCTEIKSVRHIKDLGDYLIKHYTNKKANRREIDGKLWNCSESLKISKHLNIYGGDIGFKPSNWIFKEAMYSVQHFDYCSVSHLNLYTIPKKLSPEIYQLTHQHLIDLDNLQIKRNQIDQEALLFKIFWAKIKPKLKASYRYRKKSLNSSLSQTVNETFVSLI